MSDNLGVKIIENNGNQLGILIHHNFSNDGANFVTKDIDPLQLGFHLHSKGYKTKPHYYEKQTITIERPNQEILHLIDGKIKISLYDVTNSEIVFEIVLTAGDTIFLTGLSAHITNFLENSKVFEIKFGPYSKNDRIDLGD
jgi:hypothetical protein